MGWAEQQTFLDILEHERQRDAYLWRKQQEAKAELKQELIKFGLAAAAFPLFLVLYFVVVNWL